MAHNDGDLQAWWIPQVPMSTVFEVDVASVEESSPTCLWASP